MKLKITDELKNINYSKEFYQDKILVNNHDFYPILGKKSKGIIEIKKKRIVKISYEGGKNKIYREMVGGSSSGINKGEAYITFQSKNELDNPNDSEEIDVTSGNKYLFEFLFLWNHPSLNIRLVFKIGLVLGLLSIIVGIVSIFL